MILYNILIFRSDYSNIKQVREELTKLMNHKKQSNLYNEKTSKYIKKMIIENEYESNYQYILKVTFHYTKSNIKTFIDSFKNPNLEIIHMCYNEKNNIWIVNKSQYIKEFQLIPSFAVKEILLDYMQYKESAIILDSYETIKYNRNSKDIVINESKLNDNDLVNLLFEKTLKSKVFYDIIEEFVNNFYEKCINNYENLYSNSNDINNSEEPSPLALFIVTFGIIGIIFILIKIMGYL